MEEAARVFARRVLLVHLALLAVVIALVFFASREVYDRTREQAMQQYESRQRLLASQTARGIRSFYDSIFNDLDLMRLAPSDDEDSGDEPPATAPSTRPAPNRVDWWRQYVSNQAGPAVANAARAFFPLILWKQLNGRVAVLFAVDRAIRKPGNPLPPGRPERNEDRLGPVQLLGPPRPQAGHVPGSEEAALAALPREIVQRNHEWLKTLEKPQISPFQVYEVRGEPVGMNLVAVPTGERSPRVLVAAVRIRVPQQRFMERLNNDQEPTTAILVDDTGTVMIGHHPAMVGQNVSEFCEAMLRNAPRPGERDATDVKVVPSTFQVAEHRFPPSMIAVAPVSIAGKKWTLLVLTPLDDVNLIVSRVFKRAIFWAIFVVCSMTAILVSTSFQLIRSRIRMERVRTDLLTRELTQAREIQLAWLPRESIAVPSIDIAAVNHPASHISGDFYNWFELPDGRTVVLIGDVTGHGMSAAFLMATTQLLVHNTMLRVEDPGQTLQEVNRQLCTQMFNGQFVTMLICVIDVNEGTIEVATAGHYPPILGQNGRFAEMTVEPQLVLGVEKDAHYATERFELPPSGSIALYTDGVIDARSPEGKRFGIGRVIDSLAGHAESAQSLLDSVVAHINQFRSNRELPDDLTLVCIQTQTQSSFRAAEPMRA